MSLPSFFTEPHELSELDSSEPILLGLSGGADSSALLSLLCSYRESSGCTVYAAHLNHGIRTEDYNNEALRDEQFCRNICEDLSVKLFVKRLDIPALAKASGRGIETEARNARYAFFAEIMRENNIKILATAHNSDDNLETQLQNLARGCGIDGMIGIPRARALEEVPEGRIIRPILRAEKSEILAFCAENGIPYVTDSTNAENDCSRNVIRNNIIPSLAALFPALRSSAERLSQAAKEDSDYIRSEARAFLCSCDKGIPAEKLRSLHPAVKKRVIMLAFEQELGAGIESVHIRDILALLENKKNGAAVSLPEASRGIIKDGSLYFERLSDKAAEHIRYSQRLTLGLNRIEGTGFSVLLSDKEPEEICGYTLYASARLNLEGAEELTARSRKEGAVILDGGINKKLKKLMCDKKVPLDHRNTLPIIYSGNDAIYAPLCAVSDKARVKQGCTKNVSYIAIYKTNGGIS